MYHRENYFYEVIGYSETSKFGEETRSFYAMKCFFEVDEANKIWFEHDGFLYGVVQGLNRCKRRETTPEAMLGRR